MIRETIRQDRTPEEPVLMVGKHDTYPKQIQVSYNRIVRSKHQLERNCLVARLLLCILARYTALYAVDVWG